MRPSTKESMTRLCPTVNSATRQSTHDCKEEIAGIGLIHKAGGLKRTQARKSGMWGIYIFIYRIKDRSSSPFPQWLLPSREQIHLLSRKDPGTPSFLR